MVLIKDIEWTDGRYRVFSDGRVWSVRREMFLACTPDGYGYHRVKLHLGVRGCGRHKSVHRLVAEAFIPNPEGKPEVNHKDGNKLNNRIENLEWVTGAENNRHAVETGLAAYGERCGTAKLTEAAVMQIRSSSESIDAMAAKYGVRRVAIWNALRGRTWRHLPGRVAAPPCYLLEQRSVILSRRMNGERSVDLAAEYGVTDSRIRQLCRLARQG